MRGARILLGTATLAAMTPVSTFALNAPFDYSYEADALPQASSPAFATFFDTPPTISESVSGGILTLTTDFGEDRLYRLSPGTEWAPDSDGTTLETRVKLDSVSPGASGAGDIGILTGTSVWLWQFQLAGIQEVVSGETLLYSSLSGGLDPTDGFHTFRFVVTGDSGPVSLYIDGNTTAAYTWTTAGSTSSSRIDWGDNLSSTGGQMQWDYIQWTNDGAFAPVPEPAALSLLGLGGVLTLGRRRD